MADSKLDVDGMTDEQIELVAMQMMAEALLTTVGMLVHDGATANEAFRLATYHSLVQLYGREYVRDEFGLGLRTEQDWLKRLVAAQAAIGDELPPDMYEAHLRAAVAFLKRRAGE